VLEIRLAQPLDKGEGCERSYEIKFSQLIFPKKTNKLTFVAEKIPTNVESFFFNN